MALDPFHEMFPMGGPEVGNAALNCTDKVFYLAVRSLLLAHLRRVQKLCKGQTYDIGTFEAEPLGGVRDLSVEVFR
jgi:hypothetical protein